MQNEKLEKSKKIISQYKKVFNTPDGRAVLHDMMRSGYMIWTTPHVIGDDASTFKNVGKQEFVKAILHILKIDPETYLKIVNEQEDSHV